MLANEKTENKNPYATHTTNLGVDGATSHIFAVFFSDKKELRSWWLNQPI